MVQTIIPNTTIANKGMATTNTNALFTSMVNAIIMAPNTIIGERKNNLSTIFTPDCT